MDSSKQPPCSLSIRLVSRYLYSSYYLYTSIVDNIMIKGTETRIDMRTGGWRSMNVIKRLFASQGTLRSLRSLAPIGFV